MGNQNSKQSTQKNFNPERYQGTWYEIAKYPNSFEKDCYSAIAQYKWEPQMQYLSVKNICLDKNLSPKRIREAIARVKDPNNKSVLSLKFIDGLLKSPESDYVVFSTDYNNYSIVGDFQRQYLWILTRESTVHKDDIKYIKEFVKRFGFDPDKLVFADKRIVE